MTIANSDGWNRRGLTREEYTIQVVHVGGGARVHDPSKVLERHLVQGGDEAGLIPHWSGWRCRRCSEDGVGLRACTHEAQAVVRVPAARAGALLPAPRASALLPAAAWWSAALGGQGDVAEPWSHGAVAPVLPASTVALAVPPTLFLAALAFLAAPRALGRSASDDTR